MNILQTASSAGSLLVSFAIGGVLGTVCFGGLWWTLTRSLRSHNPALWLILSALGRLGAVFTGIYLAARAGLASLLFCLAGLFVSRVLVTCYFRAVR